MKILSIATVPPGEDALWSRISNMAKILESHGHEVEICHFISRGFKAHKKIMQLNEPLNMGSPRISSVCRIPFEIHKTVKEGKFDILYCNMYPAAFLSSLARITDVPIILDMHGIPEEMDMLDNTSVGNVANRVAMRFMNYFALRLSTRIICVSRRMVLYLANSKSIDRSKLVYVTNGVDMDLSDSVDADEVEKIRARHEINHAFVFGYAGKLQPWQGVERFTEAAEFITGKKPVLLVVGGEEESRRDNVVIVKKSSKKSIASYYAACDILVLPRPRHVVTDVAAPTKFAEYCAMKKPVLVTDVGDASELVRKYGNGIVVKDNQPKNLAKGMMEFMHMDARQLSEMGRASERLARAEFDWRVISSNLMKCIDELR